MAEKARSAQHQDLLEMRTLDVSEPSAHPAANTPESCLTGSEQHETKSMGDESQQMCVPDGEEQVLVDRNHTPVRQEQQRRRRLNVKPRELRESNEADLLDPLFPSSNQDDTTGNVTPVGGLAPTFNLDSAPPTDKEPAALAPRAHNVRGAAVNRLPKDPPKDTHSDIQHTALAKNAQKPPQSCDLLEDTAKDIADAPKSMLQPPQRTRRGKIHATPGKSAAKQVNQESAKGKAATGATQITTAFPTSASEPASTQHEGASKLPSESTKAAASKKIEQARRKVRTPEENGSIVGSEASEASTIGDQMKSPSGLISRELQSLTKTTLKAGSRDHFLVTATNVDQIVNNSSRSQRSGRACRRTPQEDVSSGKRTRVAGTRSGTRSSSRKSRRTGSDKYTPQVQTKHCARLEPAKRLVHACVRPVSTLLPLCAPLFCYPRLAFCSIMYM